jgi:nucleoid-associated protein YgaU
MSYKGKVLVEEVDEANHSARLAASGRDTKGAGTARASVETRLEPIGDSHTRLLVTSDVQLTGKVASFGRGGAINDVATRLFGQFADCLRATLEAEPAAATEGAAVEDRAASGPAGATPEAAPAAASGAAASSTAPASTAEVPASPAAAQAPTAPASAAGPAATPAAGTRPAQAATPVPRPPAQALDAGSLVGTVIRGRLRAWGQAIANFFRRLFGRRRPS